MAAFSSPPTAELHVHIEGTLEPDAVFRMAARNGLPAPAASMDEFLERYTFTDLQSFLDLLYANTVVLRTEDDFHELAGGYLDRAKAANGGRCSCCSANSALGRNGIPGRSPGDMCRACRPKTSDRQRSYRCRHSEADLPTIQ